MQHGCKNHYEYAMAYLEHITDESNDKYKGSTFKISMDNGVTFSDVYRAPISSPHGPCELSDGTILWVGTEFSGTGDYMSDSYYRNRDSRIEFLTNNIAEYIYDGYR